MRRDSDVRCKHEYSAEIIQWMRHTERSADPSDPDFVTGQPGGEPTAFLDEEVESKHLSVIFFLPRYYPERMALEPVADPHRWDSEVEVLAWLKVALVSHPYFNMACTSHFDEIHFSRPVCFGDSNAREPLFVSRANVKIAVAGKPAYQDQNPGSNCAKDVKPGVKLLRVQVFP